jgi:hypothetical protein
MLRKGLAGLALVASVSVLAKPAEAQLAKGYLDVGPTLGFGSIGDAGLAFGGRLEKVIKELPSLNNGTLGIQAGFTYYSWDFGSGDNYSVIPIGVTANYHFKLSDPKLDVFLGLGLGYEIVSCPEVFGFDVCDDSSIYFIGRAGGRYFFKEKMALYADVGAGGAALNVGLMFKLK